jgi:AAA domain
VVLHQDVCLLRAATWATRDRVTSRRGNPGNGQDKPPPRKQRFPLLPFHKLTLRSSAAYLVKGIMPRVGIIVVYGPPKCGKSLWAFDIAMHSALGWHYRGRRVTSGIVIYCAFEGADGFNARAAAFRQQHGMRSDTEVPF